MLPDPVRMSSVTGPPTASVRSNIPSGLVCASRRQAVEPSTSRAKPAESIRRFGVGLGMAVPHTDKTGGTAKGSRARPAGVSCWPGEALSLAARFPRPAACVLGAVRRDAAEPHRRLRARLPGASISPKCAASRPRKPGYVVAASGCGALGGAPLGGALSDRLGRRPPLVASRSSPAAPAWSSSGS